MKLPDPDHPDRLLQDFLRRYGFFSADPAGWPNPSLEALLALDESLDEILSPLDALAPIRAQREHTRTPRLGDLPDLMAETAEALRRCPDIARAAQATPEQLELLTEQDLALGGVIVALQALHAGIDTGYLLRGAEATRALDQLDRRIAELGATLSPLQRRWLENAFGALQTRRREAQDHAAREASAATQPPDATQPAPADQAAGDPALSRAALVRLVRELVEHALEPRP